MVTVFHMYTFNPLKNRSHSVYAKWMETFRIPTTETIAPPPAQTHPCKRTNAHNQDISFK